MHLSRTGLNALANEEGLRTFPYNDSAGHATIGVGHLIHHGPVTSADVARYRGFTRADAAKLLRRDVAPRERAVDRLVRVRLNQNEFDALVSLVFNIGEGGFASSTVLRRLNAGDRRAAADAFRMWRIGGAGLAARRERERTMFLRPVPDPLAPLGPQRRRLCDKLLYHRRGALAHTGRRRDAHVHWRDHYRRELLEAYRRAPKGRQRDLMRTVLRDRNGRL